MSETELKQDTRDRLLQAGIDAFTAKSYNGVGLNEILKCAGVPKGSFYHYFESKEGFGVAVIERSAEEHFERTREVLADSERSPIERLRACFEHGREYFETHGFDRRCLIPKLALEIGQLSEPMREAITSTYDRWGSLLARGVREAQEAGEIDETLDPEHFASYLINAWEGVVVRMQIVRSLDPIDEFLRFAFVPRSRRERDRPEAGT